MLSPIEWGVAAAITYYFAKSGGDRQRVADKAMSYRGVSYRLGGSGYESCDCSGLTRNAFREAGVELPRTARQQRAIGREVPLGSLVKADLLYWASGEAHDHVGVYVGDGQVFHCSFSKGFCLVEPVGGWWTGARRVL